MKVNEFEDRNNDWLAKEMSREGYKRNNSMLEKDHQKHEKSLGWDAGAISNAKEHEILHNKNIERYKINYQKNNSNALAGLILFIFGFSIIITIAIIMLTFMRIFR